MGDQNTVLDAASARHLLRRAGFGARPADVQSIVDRGLTRGQAADELLAVKGKAFKPNGRSIDNAHDKWVKWMVKGKVPILDKLVVFFHDHFATSNAKVENVKNMARQIRTLYTLCRGSFKDLVKEINRDAAMIEFLDTVRNHKDIPNENYARELQELFTLGVRDFAGNPNYTQQDIVQIARAFTGWDYEYNSGKPVFHDYDHDFNTEFAGTRGPKVIYQSTGGFNGCVGGGNAGAPCLVHSECPGSTCSTGMAFDANGEGAQEIDTVIDIIFQHTDTDGKNTVARRLARRLFEYFAYSITDPIAPAEIAIVDQIVTQSGFTSTWSIAALARAIFVNDAFYASAAPAPFGAGTKKSVKWPVDYVVSTLRLLNMKLKSKYQYTDGGDYSRIRDQLTNMGQTLLEPPSVFGWDWETAWISSATLLARYNFARNLMASRGGGSSAFRPDKMSVVVSGNEVELLSLSDPDDIANAVTDILGITDQLTAVERNVFVDYLTDNGVNPTLDLGDYDVRNIKLHGLFALVLQSPAYQVH
jgi:uncharacterized protein (DUF1800 family)